MSDFADFWWLLPEEKSQYIFVLPAHSELRSDELNSEYLNPEFKEEDRLYHIALLKAWRSHFQNVYINLN